MAAAGSGDTGSAPRSAAPMRVTDLDGMRGVLALCIVAFHLGSTTAIQRFSGWPGAEFEFAVDVFFLLSGYVLALTAGSDPVRFAIKRYFRLAPVYYVTLALMLVAAPARGFSWSELALASPLIGAEPANFPAWSICWELYLPVLGLCFAGLQRWWPWLLGAALIVHSAVAVPVADGQVLGGTRAACGLLAGACLTRAGSLRWPIIVPFTGIITAMFVAAKWSIAAALIPPLAALAILCAARRPGLFSHEPFQFLGRISFALYMVHAPMIALVDPGHSIPRKAAVLALSVLAGYLLHHLVEMPGMRLGKRLSQV